ncbi:hypothetical protein D3C78_612210 [compost metagenome]
MAALAGVAGEFLDPLQVDDRHYADQQIDMPRHILLRRHHTAVQSFVKQHIGRFRERLPRRKRARHLVPRHGFVIGVQIFTRLPCSGMAVLGKGLFQQTEIVGVWPEIADVFAEIARLADRHVHFRAGIAMKTVALYLGGAQVELRENLTKREAGGRGSRTT